ncbi:hypothetical protein D3C71_1852570 [compost metagenome]
MIGLATNDHAERDEAIIFDGAFVRTIKRHGDCRRDFEGTGYRHDIIGRAGCIQRMFGAIEQCVGHIVIEACFHNQDVGSLGLRHGSPVLRFPRRSDRLRRRSNHDRRRMASKFRCRRPFAALRAPHQRP